MNKTRQVGEVLAGGPVVNFCGFEHKDAFGVVHSSSGDKINYHATLAPHSKITQKELDQSVARTLEELELFSKKPGANTFFKLSAEYFQKMMYDDPMATGGYDDGINFRSKRIEFEDDTHRRVYERAYAFGRFNRNRFIGPKTRLP